MSCPLKRLMELAAHFSETDRRPKNMILRLPYTEQNHLDIQQYDADFDKQKLYTVKVDYTKNIMNLPTKEELNALRDECYKIACDHGFHAVRYSPQHFLCLVISELMEAVEAHRKDHRANLNGLKGVSQATFDMYFEMYVKDTVEDELADTAIRILDLAGVLAVNIGIRFWFSVNQHQEDLVDYYRKNHSFTEVIYRIVSLLTYPVRYGEAMYMLFVLAGLMGFDLMEHIRLKMQYNRTRERLHGKKY